jgi:hypothetical protein
LSNELNSLFFFCLVCLFVCCLGDVEEDEDYRKLSKSKEVPLTHLRTSEGIEAIQPSESFSPESKWQKFKQRCPYYVPIFYWLPRYNFKRDFPRDLIAGLFKI